MPEIMLMMFVFGMFALVGMGSLILTTWEAWEKKKWLGVFTGSFLLLFGILFVVL